MVEEERVLIHEGKKGKFGVKGERGGGMSQPTKEELKKKARVERTIKLPSFSKGKEKNAHPSPRGRGEKGGY